MRKWIIALAALLVVPALGAAATIAVPPVPEQLVEGHTVFTVIQVAANVSTTQEEFAAAVAVLVREVNQRVDASRFPGVLWFNDQYLTNPTSAVARNIVVRYPCTGAVLAVDASYGVDPRTEVAGLSALSTTLGGDYVESYHITDPNDHAWDVDKYAGSDGFIWMVPILNNGATYGVPDDGTSNCDPYEDMGDCSLYGLNGNVPGVDQAVYDADAFGLFAPGESDTTATDPSTAGGWCKYRYKDPSTTGYGYPCGQDGIHYNCPNLLYNAVLYFRMNDLNPVDAGTQKDHNVGSADYTSDVSGCHPSYGYYGPGGTYPGPYSPPTGTEFYDSPHRVWPCPEEPQDDNREGNSHPYNPELPWPLMAYDGRNNHGGSADCDGDGLPDNPAGRSDYTGDYNCHATQDIRIYYDEGLLPIVRTYYVMDIIGSEAPFRCHDSRDVCNLGEFLDTAPTGYANDGSDFAGDQPYG